MRRTYDIELDVGAIAPTRLGELLNAAGWKAKFVKLHEGRVPATEPSVVWVSGDGLPTETVSYSEPVALGGNIGQAIIEAAGINPQQTAEIEANVLAASKNVVQITGDVATLTGALVAWVMHLTTPKA